VSVVRVLLRDGYGECRAMASVGYRQVADALIAGQLERDALVADVVRATRIFARRQRTWLREEPVEWLEPEEAERFPG